MRSKHFTTPYMQSPPPAVFHDNYQWEIWKNTAGKSAKETQTFLCRPFRPKSAITMWAIKHCLVEGCKLLPGWFGALLYKKKQRLAKKYPRVPVRGGICPYRHCRQQCKIFASGVNFSIFTFFVFYLYNCWNCTSKLIYYQNAQITDIWYVYAVKSWSQNVTNYALLRCKIFGLKFQRC